MDDLGKFVFGAVAHARDGGGGSIQVGVYRAVMVQGTGGGLISGAVVCSEGVSACFE